MNKFEYHETSENINGMMALRITSWNGQSSILGCELGLSLNALIIVNGIRNPFQYQPWRDNRQFEVMFDILEADIIIFQETKIQRKDLRDDMVLVPGWDCYWSLPRHKKGKRVLLCYLDETFTLRRLFRSCNIYKAISLCSYPRRGRYNRQSLCAKLSNKLL